MATITASIERDTGHALLIQASDGFTYIRDSDFFRGNVRHSYSRMPTIVDRSRSLSENLDSVVQFGRMPLAVRDLMKASPANMMLFRRKAA